jgi:hypothetical protein
MATQEQIDANTDEGGIVHFPVYDFGEYIGPAHAAHWDFFTRHDDLRGYDAPPSVTCWRCAQWLAVQALRLAQRVIIADAGVGDDWDVSGVWSELRMLAAEGPTPPLKKKTFTVIVEDDGPVTIVSGTTGVRVVASDVPSALDELGAAIRMPNARS